MIIIGADIVPTESNFDFFIHSNIDKLIDKNTSDLLHKADFRVFNLETPLSDKEDPIIKNGPNLIAPVSCASGLLALEINLLSVGNNHIKDQNEEGVKSTIQVLEDIGISYIGAGKDIFEAQKPFFTYVSGKKLGIYSCTEHEFSIADEQHWGANPFDPLESLDHVNNMKNECDYLIVLYHGGKEHYRYPSPWLQKVCRKLIDKGANLVICQHSHCIGCEEDYKDGRIVYGQGNFIFNYGNSEYWKTSLLIEVTDDLQINYHPIASKKGIVTLATGEEKDAILQDFYSRSEEIQTPGLIQQKYKGFAQEHLQDYIFDMSGLKRSFTHRVLNRLSGGKFDKWRTKRYLDKSCIKTLNYIECEAHRELLIEGLKGRNE